uniref:Mitochondrial assembly of ribosomal large subunit 1 n=1 Tax=Ovis aries TaxID=9940 RepID=A0AC11EUB4_SHEEP
MGPGSFVALRLGAQLCCRAVFPRAWPAASATPRLRLLAVGRPMARAALGRACLALDRARGLHGGPGLEEQAEGTADEGFPESGTADHAGPKFDIDMLVSLLRQENARDICVIRVPPEMKYTDYFVIGSGTSTRHLHAMAYYIVKMREKVSDTCSLFPPSGDPWPSCLLPSKSQGPSTALQMTQVASLSWLFIVISAAMNISTLGSSTSLPMTQFHSFLWPGNIPLYICTTSHPFFLQTPET